DRQRDGDSDPRPLLDARLDAFDGALSVHARGVERAADAAPVVVFVTAPRRLLRRQLDQLAELLDFPAKARDLRTKIQVRHCPASSLRSSGKKRTRSEKTPRGAWSPRERSGRGQTSCPALT